MKALITKKLGMISSIAEDGAIDGITLLSVSPNIVTQIKTADKDGYEAVQVGEGQSKKQAKTQTGHLKPSKATSKIMREFKINEPVEDMSVGQQLSADVFNIGDKVSVTGINKGKGWAGTIKRHNFQRQRKSHGAKGATRQPGSIGSMYPQKVFKGKRMAGHMGHKKTTTKNLTIALVDTENNVIGIKGAIPGPKKGIVLVRGSK